MRDMRPVVLWPGRHCDEEVAIKKVLADFDWIPKEEILSKLEHLKSAFAATVPGKYLPRGNHDVIAAFVDVKRILEGISGQFANVELPLRRYERALREVHFGRAVVWANGSIVELNPDGSIKHAPHW